jgi:SAM-dependent methyltransferase
MNEHPIYVGRDLEAMAFAENYHRWILDIFKPHLGHRIVEVGAGTGSFSEMLLELKPQSLDLVEPSREMYEGLLQRINQRETDTSIAFHHASFKQVAAQLESSRAPDSILYVNVLEHIEQDSSELITVYDTLTPGGKLAIFVPAFKWLYGNFDKEIGHFRRYTKADLEGKCQLAGFRIVQSRYFDLIGVCPWWVKYRLLRSSHLEPRAVAYYDKFAVPLTRKLERIVNPPFGKNLLIVAEKA